VEEVAFDSVRRVWGFPNELIVLYGGCELKVLNRDDETSNCEVCGSGECEGSKGAACVGSGFRWGIRA
jgi:hypothetical protein